LGTQKNLQVPDPILMEPKAVGVCIYTFVLFLRSDCHVTIHV